MAYASRDGGRPRPLTKVVDDDGPFWYSDLAVTSDGTILCLYANGETRDGQMMSFARFNLVLGRKSSP